MEERSFYTYKDSYKTFLWALLLPQVVSIVLATIFSFFYTSTEELTSSLIYLFVATILAQACFAFIVFYYNKKNKIGFKTATKLNNKCSAKNLIVCAVISVVAVFGFVNLINMINSGFASIGFNQTSYSLPNNTFYWFIINVILLAVIPAILEELVFRGMIFNGLRGRGFWFASVISTVMFALIHLSISQLIFPLIMGMIFCFVLEKTGSLKATITLHFCNNFIVLLISYINSLIGFDFTYISPNSALKVILIILIALASASLIFVLIEFCIKKPEKISIQDTNTPENNINVTMSQNNLNFADNLSNNLTKPDKKSQNKYILGSLCVGILIWLIYVLSEFFA